LSQSIILRDFLSSDERDTDYGKRFDAVMERLRQTEGASGSTYEIFLLNRDGKIVASSDSGKIGLDRASDDYFQGGKKGTHIKGPYISATTGEKSLAVSAPVMDEKEGKLLGVVVARVTPDMINGILTDRTGLGSTGESYLVDKNSYMITPSRYVKDTFLKQQIDTENIRKTDKRVKISGDIGEPYMPVRGTDYRGITVWGIKDHIPRTGWTLVAHFNENEALLPIIRIRNLIITIFLLVPVAAGLIGMYVSRIVSGPIHKLHKGTEKIGKGDLDYKVAIDTKDEIGQLSRAFDKMTTDLKGITASKYALDREIEERQKAENAVRESEERLKAILEKVLTGIVVIDPETHKIVDVNSAAARMIGLSSDTIIGKVCHEFICPTERGKCPITDLGQTVDESERILLNADGESIPILKTVASVTINGKECLVESFLDITERKKMEDEIRGLAKFPSENPNPVIRVAREGMILYSNDAGQAVLNKWKSEIGGAVPGHWMHLVEGAFEKKCIVCEDKAEEEIEGRVFSFSIAPVIDAGYVNLYARDITLRRQTEQVLKESELRYRTLFEASGEGILVADLETRKFMYANPAICRMLGYTEEELLQLGVSNIHPQEDLPNVIAGFEAQARGEKMLTPDTPCLRKDGETIYVDINAVQTVLDGKKCNVGLFSDITERKKMRETLMESEKLASIGAIITEITHEINNPLQIVTGSAQLALMREYKGEKAKNTFETIVEQGLRTKDIVDRLLRFARPCVGALKEIDINKFIDETVALKQQQYTIEGISVSTRYAPSLPPVRCDEKQIQEVLFNLTDNAVDAMPEGGDIVISTAQEGDNIKIEIADTGQGMSEATMRKVFEPFFTTRDKGTGLGLSVCYGIVQAHKGKLTFNSKQGKGTTATVLLPIKA